MDDPWQGKSVLLVDDSSTSRALIQALLKGLSIELIQAGSAAEFYALSDRHKFDLALLDVRLPDGDGVELLRDVRSRFPRAAVVLVSGKADLFTATDALVHGADGYLDKHHLKEGPQAFRQALEHAMLHRAGVLDRLELQSLKEEFLSVIVHDMRSPAASARVALRMYREEPAEDLLELAERNLDRLFQRLDRYLDYRRMEALSWRMEQEPHDLFEVVDEVVEAMRPLAGSRNLSLQWNRGDKEAVLEMDRLWVGQALENLLFNAFKHAPPQSTVRVAAGRDADQVWVTVSDEGPGIPKELVSRLFQRFSQASSQGRSGGVGLGLVIVKSVLEAHGGFVRFQEAEGGGATFLLSLPCANS